MPQKCMTYYVQTPAIDALCEKYGSHWQHMPHIEKLTIASAAAQAIVMAELGNDDELFDDPAIDYLATWDGFEFDDHEQVVELLGQLDKELDAPMAANLVTGIYANLNFTKE